MTGATKDLGQNNELEVSQWSSCSEIELCIDGSPWRIKNTFGGSISFGACLLSEMSAEIDSKSLLSTLSQTFEK